MPRFIKDPLLLQREAYLYLENISGKELSVKDRQAIPKQEPPVLDPSERSRWQDEVEQSYTPAQAILESTRCLQCKNPGCVKGCPVELDIPGFLHETAQGRFDKAADIIRQKSLLPAICGRVCPQERQCQEKCTMGIALKDVAKSVSIGRVERFLADYEHNNREIVADAIKETGKKVAIIGSGPAGLVAAADCRRAGHEVVVFEALHKLGGVLRYGIPEFRLPKSVVDSCVDNLRAIGVKFRTNFIIGRTRQLTDLLEKDGFDAVFVGVGAGLPVFMGIPGEDLIGFSTANEFLTRANLMGAIYPGKCDTPCYESERVVVLGGGNVAMDSCRMAKRLGAREVRVLYRRGRAEMPARAAEVEHAFEEGIKFSFLENAIAINGDENGKVKSVTVQRYELGEPDASGRRSPVPIEGDTYELECDTVLVAIGSRSNPLLTSTVKGLELNKRGNITADPETCQTSIPRVFAGGDIVRGAATVITAMGDGRKAAAAINRMLAQ
ncbi:MAG: NADPH-dependent glutamate synthase [bacterium]|nr:NADPH-dependent glutamate synthase [bacterium]